eukprot:scaffold49337_cov60-Phaeocystis_antarctica.AAC.3
MMHMAERRAWAAPETWMSLLSLPAGTGACAGHRSVDSDSALLFSPRTARGPRPPAPTEGVNVCGRATTRI